MTKPRLICDEVAKALSACGCPVKGYTRRPDSVSGELGFALIRGQNAKDIWVYATNDISYSVAIDKKYKQAVITVKEKARTLKVSRSIWHSALKVPVDYWKDHAPDNATKLLWIPDVNHNIQMSKDSGTRKYVHVGVLQYTLPATSITFLLGIDEEHTFISQLPKTVKSVKAAHTLLKPKGLYKRFKRIGEFFFNPVSNSVVDKLFNHHKAYIIDIRDADIDDNDDNQLLEKFLREASGSQNAACLIPRSEDKIYVIGEINLGYRHKPVVMSAWHEVVPNNEVVVDHNFYD